MRGLKFVLRLEGLNDFLFFLGFEDAESTTPPGTPPRTTAAVAGEAVQSTPRGTRLEAPSGSSPGKRRHVSDPHDLEIVKKIRQNEVELVDRNSVLRGVKPNVGCYYPACLFFSKKVSFLLRISRLCALRMVKS